MRSVRGQAVVFQPIQFNPIKRKLRIYTNIKVSIQEQGISQVNPLIRRPANGGSREFENMYSTHFINYSTDNRYEQSLEQGPMLVVCYSDFMDEMQAFVNWKNYKGIPTQLIDLSEIGGVDEMEQFISEKKTVEKGEPCVCLPMCQLHLKR